MFTKEQINEYNLYREKHIRHHNTCPLCKGPTIESVLHGNGFRECIAEKNSYGEYYFYKPLPPKTIYEYYKVV